MAAKELPSQAVLNQLLRYDPETGTLFWKERGPEWFNATPARASAHAAKIWNLRYAGKPAINTINSDGYRIGPFLGRSAKAHRVIWKLVTGCEPDQVDHIDGVRSDNRWENLRDVNQSANQRNARRRRDNKAGVTGVYWYPYERKTGKWQVVMCDKHVGMFDEFDDAVAARRAAEIEHGFHQNHGRST